MTNMKFFYAIIYIMGNHKQKLSKNVKKGGSWDDTERSQDDLIVFYNHYLKQAFKTDSELAKVKCETTPFNNDATTSNSLLVIDMQPDFVNERGAFSVADGNLMVDPLVDFITNQQKNFTKIIFSRDTHDKKHCSFSTFPEHCVINSEGAQIIDKLKIFKDISNCDVIFKGMHPDVDSFGAAKYNNDDYLSNRQFGNCCNKFNNNDNNDNNDKQKCSDLTGGKYLTDEKKDNNFQDKPFTLKNDEEPTYENIKNQFKEESFTIDDLLPTNYHKNNHKHNIFICGLAGDFCCKDTAINLAKEAADKQYKTNIKVYIINPLVRYAFLPIFSDSIKISKEEEEKYKQDKQDKELPYYVFKLEKDNKKRILPIDEVKNLKFDDIKNENTYRHFLTDPKEIVQDYKKYGVQMLMSIPTFNNKKEGGRSKNKTRKRKTNKNRKSNKKSKH